MSWGPRKKEAVWRSIHCSFIYSNKQVVSPVIPGVGGSAEKIKTRRTIWTPVSAKE